MGNKYNGNELMASLDAAVDWHPSPYKYIRSLFIHKSELPHASFLEPAGSGSAESRGLHFMGSDVNYSHIRPSIRFYEEK